MRGGYSWSILVCLILLFAADAEADVRLRLPDGREAASGTVLPVGYYWLTDGTLVTPQRIKISTNGDIDVSGSTVDDPIFDDFTDIRSESLSLPDGCVVVYSLFGMVPRSPREPAAEKRSRPDIDNYLADTVNLAEGELLSVPRESRVDGDLEFLNGCWRADQINYYTDPRKPYQAPAEFCFGAGRGTFYAYPKGAECEAGASAEFRGDVLYIETGKGACKQSKRFLMPRTFRCEGFGENTVCYTEATYNNRTFSDRALFYRNGSGR